MTTNQFFEMQLACNVSMSELLSIKDALFIAERYFNSHDMPNNAKTMRRLFDKLGGIQKHYCSLCS